MFWQYYLHPRHAIRTKNYVELFWMGLRCVAYTFWARSVIGWSPGAAILWYVIYVHIAATYIFVNFAISHTHLDVVAKDSHRTWAEYACEHTMNCTDNVLTNWWMSYLNFQIEHHLFPQMPQFRLPRIAPRVRAMFERHGKEYKCVDYWEALAITWQNFDKVAEDVLSSKRQ